MKRRVWRNHGEALAEGDPPGTSPHDSIYSPLTCNVPPQTPRLATSDSSALSNPTTLVMTPSVSTTTRTPLRLLIASQPSMDYSHRHATSTFNPPPILLCYDKVPGHVRVRLPLPFSPSRHRLTTSLQHHPLADFLPYTQNLVTRGRWHLVP